MAMSPARVMALAALVVVGGVVLAAALTLDWSRDFTTNVAETEEAALDPLLRPLSTAGSVPDVVAALRRTVADLRHWTWVGDERDSVGAVIRLVRTTPLLRFKDDVTVRVSANDGGSTVSARSQSRVGSGDLGQNPRNLRELLGVLRRQLDASRSP